MIWRFRRNRVIFGSIWQRCISGAPFEFRRLRVLVLAFFSFPPHRPLKWKSFLFEWGKSVPFNFLSMAPFSFSESRMPNSAPPQKKQNNKNHRNRWGCRNQYEKIIFIIRTTAEISDWQVRKVLREQMFDLAVVALIRFYNDFLESL